MEKTSIASKVISDRYVKVAIYTVKYGKNQLMVINRITNVQNAAK